MIKLCKEARFEYKGYKLGQEVLINDKIKAKIVGFDACNTRGNKSIAVVPTVKTVQCIDLNISESNINTLVFMNCLEDYFMWVGVENMKSLNKYIFRVGQRVWDFASGWGEVVEAQEQNNSKTDFPIGVQFDKDESKTIVRYTSEGKLASVLNRTLFFEEIPIQESALKPKRWRAKKFEHYFVVNTWGKIDVACEDNVEVDNERYKIGNYFQTKEEAEDSNLYKVFQQMKEVE